MARRYFARPLPAAGITTLSPALGHHLGRLVRTRPGDPVVLFDGEGAEVAATVVEVRGRSVRVDVGQALAEPLGRSPRLQLDVAFAPPRTARTDGLFRHGTEVGIRRFRPITTARTNRRLDRPQRWQRTLITACAQCDRLVLPTIDSTITLGELCASPQADERYVATFGGRELGPASSETALFVVGPEGGFTTSEIELLVDAGFAPRSLGPLTLRTETAVLAGATRLLQAT